MMTLEELKQVELAIQNAAYDGELTSLTIDIVTEDGIERTVVVNIGCMIECKK